MRTTTIIATIAMAILMGSAPASSLNVPHPLRAEICSVPKTSAISLVGSHGAFGVMLITEPVCIR